MQISRKGENNLEQVQTLAYLISAQQKTQAILMAFYLSGFSISLNLQNKNGAMCLNSAEIDARFNQVSPNLEASAKNHRIREQRADSGAF